MIEIRNLTKRYNNKVFMNKLNIEISSNEITLLCGKNGAGKSTLIKCILGLTKYSGDIYIDKYSNKSVMAKNKLGYIPEHPEIYEELTVWDHIEFHSRIYKVNNWESKANRLCKDFDLLQHKNKLGYELSKGMLQKTSIIMGLIHDPDVLIIDEPFVGLDPQSIDQFKKYILEYKKENKTLIISTHILDAINFYWDKTIILDDGFILDEIRHCNLKGIGLSEYFLNVTNPIR